MYLKKIEIAGFKSFADRTVIEFDKGLTAVVGPNGSGKSNITEAIRWVLGEQSAKNLRGGKMPDVIFAGTDKRKPLNIAEVTVVLDNTERYLPIEFSEVSVTRRLNRSGDSDFFINKQACRLKDIVDLFMDSGLGKESFSIISQGKVEAIFNSKPEDRRGIFEEAAGVLKYKQRKRKAEQKLFETEDNLNRVQDIIYELESQLEPLAEQSKIAEQYLEKQKDLTVIDVGVTVAEIEILKKQWELEEGKVEELNQSLVKVETEISQLDEQLQSLREQRAKIDQTIDNNQQNLLIITENYEQAEGQKNVLLERSKNTETNILQYQENYRITKERLSFLEKEQTELQSNLEQKKEAQSELTNQISLLEAEVKKYSLSAKERLEELRSQYVEVMQAQANVGNDLKHLEKQYTQETSKNQQAIERHEHLLAKQEQMTEKETEIRQAMAIQSEYLHEYRESYSKKQRERNFIKEELSKKEQQMYKAMGVLQQARARKKSLQELQENYAGFYQGVRTVLKERGRLQGIVGAVAELMNVPAEYALAIETALGGAAQSVVVKDEQSGREAISFLKKKQLGRATFLPLTTIKPRTIPQNIQKELKDVTGFLGIASEVVSFESMVAPVMKNLLGVTILAKDLSSANRLAQQVHYQYRVVSLEGDIMNPGGSMTGGANKRGNKGSLFSQTTELETISSQLTQMEQEMLNKEEAVKRLKEQVNQLDTLLDDLRKDGEQAGLKEQEYKNQLELLESEKKQLEKEKRAFEYEAHELTAFLEDFKQRKEELTNELTNLQATRTKLDVEMSQTDEEQEKNTVNKEQAQDNLNEAQAKLAVIKEQVGHVRRLISDKGLQLKEGIIESQKLEQQIQLLTSNTTNHLESQETIEERMNSLQKEKDALQKKIIVGKEQRESLHEKIERIDNQFAQKNKQQQDLLSLKNQAEVNKNRAELGMDNALKHLQEEYSLTFEAGKAQYLLTMEISQAKIKIRELKQEIEALGIVNVSAIEQFEQVNERYVFLTSQRDDLLEAKESLFDTMNEMDEVVKTKFKEVFDAISEQFEQVFPQMFGGGYAQLKLTDPSDLLYTGIEIVAQPPGKKLQSLSLLSGGERALTAIALLFSIIQVRPVPFCVLDEVEAALDEANVARFGQYLRQFETDMQFIVITHRKGTMEAADVLYGVTMQESGVSTIVSVRLEDVNDRGDFESDNK